MVLQAGATPIILDVDENNQAKPRKIQLHFTDKTKAVIAVHLWSSVLNNEIKAITKYNLFLIEDCAEAHGAEVNE